jgi:hypothetical protein
MLCMWTQEHFKDMPAATIGHIHSALEFSYGERRIQDVMKELVEGSKQIWLGTIDGNFVATVVTHIIDYPGKRTCEICYLGGEAGSGILQALGEVKAIEDWAIHNECDDIQVFGRRGWLKALKNHGYSERYTIAGKSLSNPQDNKGSNNET